MRRQDEPTQEMTLDTSLPREDFPRTEIMLRLLSTVECDQRMTQRSLSRELGIALGLANTYLKRCARKGLIKIRQAPFNCYAYYLTPAGFAEKGRLTAEYLADSFEFFRNARHQCRSLLDQCADHGWRRVALAGIGDLAEIAVLSAGETEAEIVAIIAPGLATTSFAGCRLVNSLNAAVRAAGDGPPLDAVIVTDVATPQATFERMIEAARTVGLSPERVLAPPLLRITWPEEQPRANEAES